ncbi:putative glycolipid-binding domain-containing protein [Streptomyces sp. NPDC048639]|uniref:putative glycolipid-binding domain-containing protein n=1 Tax=Streptomyces sp. NPDC048639 TaxID=3365581 RepID=UPI0037171228
MAGRPQGVTWRVTGSGGFETAWTEVSGTVLRARGRVVGTVPEPYWMTYELETGGDYVTRRLFVSADTASGDSRSLDLRREEDGRWTANGSPLPDVTGAEDCDLGLSPLTNAMPVLRHGLHTRPGEHDFLMAWVSVPDLTVTPSPQTYTHLETTDHGARVRFTSEDFTADLELDPDGLVVTYPGLAFRSHGPGTELASEQHRHWQETYRTEPDPYGPQPSEPAVHAAITFRKAGARTVLELGAGHGRDALYLARAGFDVTAADFSAAALERLREHAEAEGLAERVETVEHDVRRPLPFPDTSVDAVHAHMLLSMALSTEEIRALVDEIARVLRPGGVLVYTVRHTGDAHYGKGTSHGDSVHEHDGFAVHFFDRELVDSLAQGWDLREVHPFEEGTLPRRLWRVTQTRRPGPDVAP